MKQRGRQAVGIAAVASVMMVGFLLPARGQDDGDWSFSGGDVFNTRNAAEEWRINPFTVGGLKKKWEFVTHGDVSATPTVEVNRFGGQTVYAVDWGGYLYSINGDTGVPNWSRKVSDYTGNTFSSTSRTSPAIVGNTIVIGDQGDMDPGGLALQGGGTTASVMAINKFTGKLVWRTTVSSHPFSVVSASPVAYNGVLYVGVSSLEENAGFIPGYIYSWRGKVVALDAETGAIKWSFTTIDDSSYAQGFTGASVWGSTPVVDAERGSLYVSTGNNYSSPAGGDYTSPGGSASPAGDHFDSVLALDLHTGNLKWAFRAWNGDTWDVASWTFAGRPHYQYPDDSHLGPDWDFGSGPSLFRTFLRDIVGAGAKSGFYYALDPNTGALLWKTQAGPGGTGGGIEWGSAGDGWRVYCAIANTDNQPNPVGGPGYHAGHWTALDAFTGKPLWATADPLGGHDVGMVTIANGVMFAGSASPGASGGFFALSAFTGKILWQFTTADDPGMGSVICGPSVVDGTVYWGSGYSHLGNAFGSSGTPKLYAFSLR